ncbi:type VI secretion system baseplate subunit TssF [Pantoea ananatis]
MSGVAVMTFMVWKHPDIAGIEDGSQQQIYWLIAGGCISGCALIVSVVLLAVVRNAGKQEFNALVDNTNGDDEKKKRENDKAPVHPAVVMCNKIRGHLRSRIGLNWRRKTRLLLITGDEAAIELLVPGLQENQWLEGNRTVLIYGGSLTAEPDKEKYAALRKLRRGRPLDGIVRVMPGSLNLTPQVSDNDLRGLEKISELLRYSAPVWLWQLCDSSWSQAKRTEQTVGASFPLRADQSDIVRQLERMLPALRAQGMSQVLENNGHDFLLRLGRHLKDGGIARWAQQLVPWLSASQQRVPLRGLMFSLPENKPAAVTGETAGAAPADAEKYIPSSQRHALTLPVTWQGIVDDCARVRGRRVGMAWEQTLARALMTIIAIWGAGTLLSFAANRQQIVSVAQQAHALVAHPAVSDDQLTALHRLRNEAGRLQHRIQEGAPWYQRFGLDHNQQLLDAMLPWYGVANNRLIRDPANAALAQKLSVLAGSAHHTVPEDESLSLTLTGTNGQLPRRALQSTVLDTVMKTTSTRIAVRNLCAPTLPCYPPAQDRFHWRVLSHLGSGFLSMMDNADVLRGTLALYEWTDSEMNRRRLEAIIEVKHSETERFEQGYLVRGVQIEVTLDSHGFAGRGDICLFGEMLSRFFALYTDIYLFNRLIIILQPNGERLEWQEKHNRRIPG